MTLRHRLACVLVCLLAPSVTSVHHGRLGKFYYDKDMEKGMFSYGFEVEPMNKGSSSDHFSGMSFGIRHHRHDDGTQSWGYAIGSGPLPAKALEESGPSVGTSPKPASAAASHSDPSVLTVRPSVPAASAVRPEQAVRPGVFQVPSGRGRLVYVRRERLPEQRDPLDGYQLLGSEKVHQVVPFHGDFGARLSRRLQPDESAQQWRGQTRIGGSRRRQQIRPQQLEQQQQQPALFPSEQQPESDVFPSEQQQEDPPVTTYRPSVRPTLLATATLQEPASGPDDDLGQSAPSGPIHVTQVVAAAQPVTEFRGTDGSVALPGSDPRFQRGRFATGPPFPGAFPSGVGGGTPFGFVQQGPPFGGNFPTGPAPGFNGFPGNNFFGSRNPAPRNNGFFGNDIPSARPNFGTINNAQFVGSDTIRTSGQFQPSNDRLNHEDSFNQFGDLQQIPDVPTTTPSPIQEDDTTDPSPSSYFKIGRSKSVDASSSDTNSPIQPVEDQRRYRDGDSNSLTDVKPTLSRIRSGGRRPGLRRQRPTSDSSPLLSASQTPDSTDDKVFADPEPPSADDEPGAGFRRRPSKAIILTAASVYQDDALSRNEPERVAVSQFEDLLNGTRIVIRRRLKKVPRVSESDTPEPSENAEYDDTISSTTEEPRDNRLIGGDDNSEVKSTDSNPTFNPDRHQGPEPKVLAVGRRRNRFQPRRHDGTTTETPDADSALKDVHPVEAPPTRRYGPRFRLGNRGSRKDEDDTLSDTQSEDEAKPAALGEGSDSDTVLARPPTDRVSLLEQRKAARIANRRRPSSRRLQPDSNNDEDGAEVDSPDNEEEPGQGRRLRNRLTSRRLGRPQRGPVRPSQQTTPSQDSEQDEVIATPESDVTTPSSVSDDGETSFATVAAAPTEEPARQRGASRLRRPGRPGGRLWRTQEDDSEDQVESTNAPGLPSEPSTVSDKGYLPTTPKEDEYRNSDEQGYLPTTDLGVKYPSRTSQSPSYLPTTESGRDYTISTAQGPSYLPTTESGVTTVPTTVRPRSLMDRYKEDRLAVAQAREDWLRAQFDRNQAVWKGGSSDDSDDEPPQKEDFRSLFTRKLEEKLSSDDASLPTTTQALPTTTQALPTTTQALPITTQAPVSAGDSGELHPDDAASRAARIQALFAQYTKATQPPSTTTTTDPPPLPLPTTVDPNAREAKLQALFAQYTKGTTPADTSSTADPEHLQKLFAMHVKSLGTTEPTPVVVESFRSSVSRVGATPSIGASTAQDDADGLHAIRGGYLPQLTTLAPYADSTVSDATLRPSTRQPDLDLSQVQSPLDRPYTPPKSTDTVSDDDDQQNSQTQKTTVLQPSSTTTRLRQTTRLHQTTRAPVTEPTTSSADPGQWTLDSILESVQPTTRLASPSLGNAVSFSEPPPTTTHRPASRPTRRPDPARPFDGFNGIDDERHAEKLTLDGEGDEEPMASREVLLPVRSGAQPMVTSLLVMLVSSWMSLGALRLAL